MQKYGNGGKALFWMKEFLNKRTFSFCVNSAHSENFPVDSSVPQRTKLGPLMYILFVNDIVKLFKFVKIKIYADDISLYAIVNTSADKIAVQNKLNLLHNLVSYGVLKLIMKNVKQCILDVVIIDLTII